MRKNKRKKSGPNLSLPVPPNDRIASLCELLVKNRQHEEVRHRYAPVQRILAFVGVAGVVGLSLIAPSAAMLAKPFLDEERRKQREEWKHYNPSFLRRSLKRLSEQKLVEIKEQGGESVVILTSAGKRRILKYAIDELAIEKPKIWDRRWRLIIYDVDERKKKLRDVFRSTLKTLGFLKLQQSVWLYPYPCENHVTFLREYYGVGNEVLYVVATKIENDSPYRTYFNLET